MRIVILICAAAFPLAACAAKLPPVEPTFPK